MVSIRSVARLCAFAILVGTSSLAHAQEASVAGVVSDTTKAQLPGVSITATNLDTGIVSSTVSGADGSYRLPPLPPGRYSIQAELSGFATLKVPSIELLVGQRVTIPLTLNLASLNEALIVTGEAPLVDVASTQVAGNVNRQQMETLPLQGRNWLELSKLVKGITANEIGNTPGVADDMFQLNLDGQQITQKIVGSGFGQPKFSREAIAEFQIVTNMFDITQGRSLGTQVQAVSRSGTNTIAGSFYGNFRDDELNAPNPISKTVLPYHNQQIGGTLGGPIVRDRLHYFVSVEDEREPGTAFSTVTVLRQTFETDYKNSQKSVLGRADGQLTPNDRASFRFSRWDWANPFVTSNSGHPSASSNQDKSAVNIFGTWSKVLSSSIVQEIKGGDNNFKYANLPQAGLENTIEYRFPGLTIGKPYNYPQIQRQNNYEARWDLTWHRGDHDMKIGGEYLRVLNQGDWRIQEKGIMFFTSVPADIASRIPLDAAMDPSQWNLVGLDSFVQRFDQNFHVGGEWTLNIPRPTWALWFGDNWRVGSQLTLNYGVRWDVDLGATDAPDVIESTIPIDNGVFSGDFGFKRGIRDLKNVAPRAGFNWNVGGRNDLSIRGGAGLYFATPVSNITFSPQIFSQMVTATFANDGRAGFVTDPTRGIDTYEEAKAALPAQSPRIIDPNFRNPYTIQSSLGFQKQVGPSTGFDVDLVHYNGYRDPRTIDPNLFYDPVTGYNKNPATAGRPNPAYGVISYFVSTGHQDQTMVTMSVNRRLSHGVQGGATYALMLAMHDDGSVTYGGASGNNPFDNLDGEYATSTAFQRNTVRTWAIVTLPFGVTTSLNYAYGSGTRYAASIATTPYGKGGTNRLNLTASGGTTNAITIPEAVLDRWNGPAVINSGDVIPRNALEGTPIHKFDLRLQKDVKLGGRVKAQLIGEVFNLFNHANYTTFATSLSATSATTTALFGSPTAASVSRQGQLAFRVSF